MSEKVKPPKTIFVCDEVRNPIDGYWCSSNLWGENHVEYIQKAENEALRKRVQELEAEADYLLSGWNSAKRKNAKSQAVIDVSKKRLRKLQKYLTSKAHCSCGCDPRWKDAFVVELISIIKSLEASDG